MSVTATRRLTWLCNELVAGNAFSADLYRKWADDGLAETPAALGKRGDPCYSDPQQELRR